MNEGVHDGQRSHPARHRLARMGLRWWRSRRLTAYNTGVTLDPIAESFCFALLGCLIGAWVSLAIAKHHARQQNAFVLYERMEAARLEMDRLIWLSSKKFYPGLTLPSQVPTFVDWQDARDAFVDLSSITQHLTLLPKMAFRKKKDVRAIENGIYDLWALTQQCVEGFQVELVVGNPRFVWMPQAEMKKVSEDFQEAYRNLIPIIRKIAGFSSPEEVAGRLAHRLQ